MHECRGFYYGPREKLRVHVSDGADLLLEPHTAVNILASGSEISADPLEKSHCFNLNLCSFWVSSPTQFWLHVGSPRVFKQMCLSPIQTD